MNKVLAEIIAGVIPHKMTRNRWRGLLRYGLLNVIRLKYRMKHDHSVPQYYLTVCAIAKNEGPYFKEWIEWHHKQGVEKFYIYDNESTDCTKEVLEPYIKSGLVEYRYWPGRKQQLAAYDDCFERHRTEARWIAVIDLDEYIVPIKDQTIPEFLHRMEKFSVVEINWLVYGSGGAKTREPGGIMERFRKHSLPEHRLNTHVKSIAELIPMVSPSKNTSVIVNRNRMSYASTTMPLSHTKSSLPNGHADGHGSTLYETSAISSNMT